ncbi:hypothetical protein D3OALGA1CA_5021 [Olavius algarvensis associated proteobacterium Delta 3]|nr:hypothetical protein D3OALGA1CA_5021 [Olavius algarvensis associated proteobacterium Delta 3]
MIQIHFSPPDATGRRRQEIPDATPVIEHVQKCTKGNVSTYNRFRS